VKIRTLMLSTALVVVLPMLVVARQGDESSVPRMSLPAFKKALESGRILALDVRDAGSYESGHIPGAILVTLEDVAKKAAELKATKRTLVTYCA
jgi:3-mercaptopyruvate sulfurtransferase SseA